MKVTFLGTGTSTGVPQIGCQCPVCTSTDARDKRLRASILVETDETVIIIDCSPDFRQQHLRLPFRKIDAMLLTNEHYDHVGGIDDLRPFSVFGPVQLYMEERVENAIRERMPYCFADIKYGGIPEIDINRIYPENTFHIHNIPILPVRVMHHKLPILGFRIKNLAYLTDVKTIPESEFSKLKHLDTLIISALRKEAHFTHQTLAEALRIVHRLQPKKAYFTHMSHQIGLHNEVEKELPHNVFLAHDGLEIPVSE